MKTVPQSDEQLRQEVSARYARTALQGAWRTFRKCSVLLWSKLL